jgi:hypothetical protein
MNHYEKESSITITENQALALMNSIGCLTYLLVFPFVVLLRGFVLVQLWSWFIVPVFELKPLRIVYAIGIMLIITYVMPNRNRRETRDNELSQAMRDIFGTILMAVLTLSFGWIVSRFV